MSRFLLILAAIITLTHAADTIHLVNARIHTDSHPTFSAIPAHQRFHGFHPTENNHEEETHQFILQFHGDAVHHDDKKRVESELNAKLGQYLPNNAFMFVGKPDTARRAEEIAGVKWVGVYRPEFKVAPSVRKLTQRSYNWAKMNITPVDDVVRLTVLLPLSVRDEAFLTLRKAERLGEAWARRLDARVVVWSEQRLEFRVKRSRVDEVVTYLSKLPLVHWIEHQMEFEFHNKFARWSMQSNEVGNVPIYNLGLHGEGEIVGCGDSGLDYDMCFFSEDGNAPAINDVDQNHRKVVSYFAAANELDQVNGHGTHVVGSILGEATAANGPGQVDYNGLAYAAKVAFVDVGNGGRGLQIPLPLNRNYFPLTYSSGARIHTNSWGSQNNAYNADSYETDTFQWLNKNFLTLFSAGNDGEFGFNTVGTPATAKNTVSVGATRQSNEAWAQAAGLTGDPVTANLPPFMVNGVVQTPELYNQDCMACFSSRGPTADGRLKPDISAPGELVISARSDDTTDNNGNTQCQSLTGSVFFNAGTSMSCPLAAGAAALIRQYLREGYYPSGTADPANAIPEPSAAQIKALMVNSGQTMTGLVDTNCQGSFENLPLTTPNLNTGHGRIQLDTVLKQPDSPFDLYIHLNNGQDYELSTGEAQSFCFNANPGGKVAVTLAWMDYPGDPNAGNLLVNDLDLEVSTPDGTTLAGNYEYLQAQGLGTTDNQNTVERVVIPESADGEYCVNVIAKNVPEAPQSFSVVMTAALAPGESLGDIGDSAKAGTSKSSGTGGGIMGGGATIFVVIFIVVAIIVVGGIGYYVVKKRKGNNSLDTQFGKFSTSSAGQWGAQQGAQQYSNYGGNYSNYGNYNPGFNLSNMRV